MPPPLLGSTVYQHVGTPVDFTAEYLTTDGNHSMADCYWYAINHVGQPQGPVSGSLAMNRLVRVDGGVTEQTEQVMRNLGAVLAAAGAGFGDVIKTTVFLRDMADFAAMNAVYGRHFADHHPARSTVAVAGLPRGVVVEIELVAALRG